MRGRRLKSFAVRARTSGLTPSTHWWKQRKRMDHSDLAVGPDPRELQASEAPTHEETARHLDRAIGTWKRAGIDVEAFKEYLKERRAIRSQHA